MSKCSRELNSIFDQIAENAILRNLAGYGTPEWNKKEEKAKELFQKATNIFLHYHPECREKRKKK